MKSQSKTFKCSFLPLCVWFWVNDTKGRGKESIFDISRPETDRNKLWSAFFNICLHFKHTRKFIATVWATDLSHQKHPSICLRLQEIHSSTIISWSTKGFPQNHHDLPLPKFCLFSNECGRDLKETRQTHACSHCTNRPRWVCLLWGRGQNFPCRAQKDFATVMSKDLRYTTKGSPQSLKLAEGPQMAFCALCVCCSWLTSVRHRAVPPTKNLQWGCSQTWRCFIVTNIRTKRSSHRQKEKCKNNGAQETTKAQFACLSIQKDTAANYGRPACIPSPFWCVFSWIHPFCWSLSLQENFTISVENDWIFLSLLWRQQIEMLRS